MSGVPWTTEELDVLREGVARGKTFSEIAQSLPQRTPAAVWSCAQRIGLKGSHGYDPSVIRVIRDDGEVRVSAPVAAADAPAEDVYARAAMRCSNEVDKMATEGLALVQIMTDLPIALSISADWHISTDGACDLPALRAYAETIAQTPGAYALAVGDLHDNPIKWSRHADAVPEELTIVDLIFGIFGTKLLGTTDGNHDAWSRMFAGVDNIKWLAERGRIHYAPDELVYVIEIVSPKTNEVTAKYVIATRHQYWRNSQLNVTHACWRWLEDRTGQWPLGDDGMLVPDVLAIGHSHNAAVEDRAYYNKTVWAARLGPWQTSSRFARQHGWKSYRPTAPTFILYPTREHDIVGLSNYRKALEILGQDREAWIHRD